MAGLSQSTNIFGFGLRRGHLENGNGQETVPCPVPTATRQLTQQTKAFFSLSLSLSWNLKNSETQNFLNSLLHPHLTDHAFAPRYVFNDFFFFCSRKTILNLIVLDLLYPLFVYVDFEFHCWNNSIPLRFLIIIANQSQNLVQFSYYCTFLDVYRKYIYYCFNLEDAFSPRSILCCQRRNSRICKFVD